MKSYFLCGPTFKNSQGGAEGHAAFDRTFDLQGTIGHSEEEPQTLWGALHPPLPKPHRSTTVSLGIWRATLACPTFPSLPESQYFLQDQSPCKSHTPSCLHFPHRTYHLLFLSLQNLVLFIALSQLHKNSAWITVVTQ